MTKGRETGATGAGKAFSGVGMGVVAALGKRGAERRDRGAFGADNGVGGDEVRVAILGGSDGATYGVIVGAVRDNGLGVVVKFMGGGGAACRVGARVGSLVVGIFSFECGMLRGGDAKNLPLSPTATCDGRRASRRAGRRTMTGREGKGAIFRYKSGRVCFGPSASRTPKSTLAVGLPY
jgi:hypothetical protein